LHKAIYYELREKFDLPSQFAIRVIGRVADSYKLNKKVQHKFNKSSSAEYDQRLLSWTALDNVSIASLDGRLHLPIAFGKYAKLDERTIRKSCKLAYKNKEFYLQVSYEEPEVLLKDSKDFLGVDLGITNLAVTSNGQVFSGSQVDKVRERFTTIKTSLQACGSKSAKRHLKKLSGKEYRFKRNTNHVISKQIVSLAKALEVGLSIEDLKGFKKTVRKSQRERFGKWAFGQLAGYIEYKAKLAGVEVVKVNPRNTSRTCSACGHCEKANRKIQADFQCKQCGMTMNADLNAAINIAAIGKLNKLKGEKLPLPGSMSIDLSQHERIAASPRL
jgi:IS605 OrfB family transposase